MRLIENSQGPPVLLDGHEVVLLGSNDYLGHCIPLERASGRRANCRAMRSGRRLDAEARSSAVSRFVAVAGRPLHEQAVANARAAMFEPLGVIFTTITPDVNDLHEEIFVSIRDKDANAARDAMARHIGVTLQQVESALRGTH